MPLYGAAKAPNVPDDNGQRVLALTDNSGGTANETLEDIAGLTISGTYDAAEVQALRDATANDIADLAAKISALIDHMNAGRNTL